MLANLNHTFITLIPKVKKPEFVSEFQPISLCNVLYKFFSKVLANRLKKILPNIITEYQSAFTKSRLISDNILVAFESLHSMQRHTGKDDNMTIKLDMSKAYDRVEWVYLEAVMRKMGFAERWVRLMMTCITSVSYSILINGEPKGMVVPTRGIRQGDPLSPFLFLLCTEGLNGLISQAANRGNIKGFALCKNSPRLTHLLWINLVLLNYILLFLETTRTVTRTSTIKHALPTSKFHVQIQFLKSNRSRNSNTSCYLNISSGSSDIYIVP